MHINFLYKICKIISHRINKIIGFSVLYFTYHKYIYIVYKQNTYNNLLLSALVKKIDFH